jgi:hypothetical protein
MDMETMQEVLDTAEGTSPVEAPAPAEEDFSLPEAVPAGQDPALPVPGDSLLTIPEIPVAGTDGLFTGLIEGADEYSAQSLSISPGDWMIASGENYDLFVSYTSRADVESLLVSRNLQIVLGREAETPSGMYR